MTSIVCFLIMFATLVGCSDGNAGRLGDGGGADAVDASTSASMSTSVGLGGFGAGGFRGEGGGAVDETTIAIATLADCPAARAIAPGPTESGAIALNRFDASRLPFSVTSFTFLADIAAPGCAPLDTEIIAFAGAGDVPDESPAEARAIPVALDAGVVTVPIDPPLELTAAASRAFVGVRVVYSDAGKTCIAACAPHRRPELNYWSDRTEAPYGWRRLSDSPTPALGPDADWLFAVVGR